LADILDSSPLKPFGQMNRNLVGSIYEKSSVTSYQISDHLAKRFQRKRFLEIDQSKTRIACGGHVCSFV
jgi:hypothetical protein